MMNLLGDLWGSSQPVWDELLKSPSSKLHLYGKHAARSGRKMGHFCMLHPDINIAILEADRIFSNLPQV
jgi:5-(carboxyamino)imidazole ribonucleotide synthase